MDFIGMEVYDDIAIKLQWHKTREQDVQKRSCAGEGVWKLNGKHSGGTSIDVEAQVLYVICQLYEVISDINASNQSWKTWKMVVI